MPGLGEEAPVDRPLVPVVGGVLEEDVDVIRLVTQPCEERRRCLERPTVDVGLTEAQQVPERLMEREHVPRSTIERKKAVERARGALHNANTGIGAQGIPQPLPPPAGSRTARGVLPRVVGWTGD